MEEKQTLSDGIRSESKAHADAGTHLALDLCGVSGVLRVFGFWECVIQSRAALLLPRLSVFALKHQYVTDLTLN